MTAVRGFGPHVQRLLLVLALLVAGLGVASLRTAHLGRHAADAAEAAFDRGDLAQAVRSARRAAGLTVPGAPHVDRAFRRLEVIARGAEALGDTELSIAAWEAVRTAAVESSPWSSERPELDRANQNLARLRARAQARFEPTRLPEHLSRDLLAELNATDRSGRAVLWLALGFTLSVAGLGWTALRGVTGEGRWLVRDLILGIAILATGLACWTFAVYTA